MQILRIITTYFPSNFFNSSATGFRENFSFLMPFGRPRWLIKTTDLAPFSNAYFMVGRAATILKVIKKQVSSFFNHTSNS